MTDSPAIQTRGSWKDAWDDAISDSYMGGAAYGATILTPRASLIVPIGPTEEELLADEIDPTIKKELRNLTLLSVPLSLSNLCGLLINLVAIGFCGRLGAFELSAVVLATSVFNVSGLSVLTGFASAMETFTGQAYGARQYRRVGIVLQRAIMLTTILVAAVGLLWHYTDKGLVALGQDPALAKSAREYLLAALPALYLLGIFESLKRYLMAQGVATPVSLATGVGLVLAPAYNYLFIFKFGYGLLGAALAYDAVELTLVLVTLAYIIRRDRALAGTPEATWPGWTKEALTGWGEYFTYALPSILMVCCEWWTFEAVILMSGLMPDPNTSVATMGIAIDTAGLQFMIVSGIAMALSTRASNSLGAGHPHAARCASLAGIGLTAVVELLICVGLWLCGIRWAGIFTDVPAVLTQMTHLLPLVITALPGDGQNILMQGLLRGAGQQHASAGINMLCYWCFGIPLAYYLGIVKKFGLAGLWYALISTNILLGIVMLAAGLTLNFEKISAQVADKFAQEEEARQALLAAENEAGAH